MLTEKQLMAKYSANEPLTVVTIGDSFTYGYTSVAGTTTWTNGLPYLFNNQGINSPHNDPSSPYYLDGVGYLSQAKQDDVTMHSFTRLLYDHLLNLNPASVVHNMGISGSTAGVHLRPVNGQAGTTPQNIAALPTLPDVAFIILGPNSAKNNQSQEADLRELTSQIQVLGVFVVLVQPSNIGVTQNTENGITPDFSTTDPDGWYPKRSLKNTNDDIVKVFRSNNTGWFSCGNYDLTLNVTEMYDPFHPNPDGHVMMFNKFVDYLNNGTLWNDGAMLKTANGKSYYQSNNGNQAFKAKASTGQTVSMPLVGQSDQLRINTSEGLLTFND